MTREKYPPYTLGLDIGIASIGAALLADNHIIGLHVRTFDKAETDKNGLPLGLIRRNAKGMRKCIRRRSHRLLRLRRLFKRECLLADTNPETLRLAGQSPWELRAQGLVRCLNPQEWACVLYHLIKHRGFQSTRKNESQDDKEVGKLLGGVNENKKRMQEKGYRSIGEMIACDPYFHQHKRNKGGDYSHSIDRSDIVNELRLLFTKQRLLGNQHVSNTLEEQVHNLLLARRPALSGDHILGMVGKCSLEPTEYRAPKASYRAERFIWLGKLNNLKITGNGESRPLTNDERQKLIDLPFSKGKLTYKQVRKLLELPERLRFNLVSYRKSAKDSDPENSPVFEAKAFHSLRKAYEKAGLNSLWQRDALDPDRLDTIAFALSCYKNDPEIREYLTQHEVEDSIIEAIRTLSFDSFINFSQKALQNLLPLMEAGKRTDEAKDTAYPNSSNTVSTMKKCQFLPAPDKNIIRNPVVFRALNQSRKLLNAIIAEYGSPKAVHIELARDLSKPFDERKKIEKEQKTFQEIKQKYFNEFTELFNYEPNSKQLHKYRLYQEQNGKCAYSLTGLDLNRIITDDNYTQIDHILPYSRSYDDSQNNKVLVLSAENQNKGNRTPFEYLGGENSSDRWCNFEAWVHATHGIRQAKRNRLLRKHFDENDTQGFHERNLNDTRYICREFKKMVETYLEPHESATKNIYCITIAGQMTSLLRARWGLIKSRENGDMHHALDAAVIAATNHTMVHRVAQYSKRKELEFIQTKDYVDPSTGEVVNLEKLRQLEKEFPQPWPHFRSELIARLSPNPVDELKKLKIDTLYPSEFLQSIHPIRVSRAPLRRGLGAAHEDTIRSIGREGNWLNHEKSTIRTPLSKLSLKDIENIAGADDPRNDALIQAIRKRLEEFDGKGEKAFAENQPPLLKPSAEGKIAPRIRSVKLINIQKSGILIRNGIANNDTIVRVDIFTKKSKYYSIPIYVADTVKKDLPNRAVVSGKTEKYWLELDNTYIFCFSIYHNDWLRITLKTEIKEGYFAGFDRATGSVSIWTHDRDQRIGDKGKLRGIGIKTALKLEKFNIDMLGNLYRCNTESRQPLCKN